MKNGFRLLDSSELEYVAGGEENVDDTIVVTGRRLEDDGLWRLMFMTQEINYMDGGDSGGGGGLYCGPFDTKEWQDREDVFRGLLEALIPGSGPQEWAVVETLVTLRSLLLNLVSIDNRLALDNWLNQNSKALVNYFYNNVDGLNRGENPLDSMKNLFGIETIPGFDD